MSDISDYRITFHQNPLLGWWSWTAVTPEGGEIAGPIFGVCIAKDAAERDALQRIRRHAAKDEMTGDELAERVARHRSQEPVKT